MRVDARAHLQLRHLPLGGLLPPPPQVCPLGQHPAVAPALVHRIDSTKGTLPCAMCCQMLRHMVQSREWHASRTMDSTLYMKFLDHGR